MQWMQHLTVKTMKKQRKIKKKKVLILYYNLFSSDELVDQVLGELNINMANQIPCKLF